MSGVAAGYPGHHVSNPNQLPQLIEAATNCVQNFCQVQPGENVLIVAEFDSDPLVVASFMTAASAAGAEVASMTVKPFSAGGHQAGAPGDMLMGAYAQADVVIACTYFEFAHSEKTFFSDIFGSEKRVCSLIMTATPGALVTSGRFPIGLYMEIAKRAYRELEHIPADGHQLLSPQGERDHRAGRDDHSRASISAHQVHGQQWLCN
jgi:hypothetical protein